MYTHAPENYTCPICLGIYKTESDATMLKTRDLLFEDKVVCVFLNSKFVKSTPGHLIVVPKQHVENVYDLPDDLAARIASVARQFALALKEVRKCDGITLLQNNEPASSQHAFHYHLHIFPRFTGDEWREQMYDTVVSTPEQREPYIDAIKAYLVSHPIV